MLRKSLKGTFKPNTLTFTHGRVFLSAGVLSKFYITRIAGMSDVVVESQMFNFSTRLFFHKHAISKRDGYVSLYIEVYVSSLILP